MTGSMKGMLGMLAAVAAVTFTACDGEGPTTDVDTARQCITRTPPVPTDVDIFDCSFDRCAECGHQEAPACCFEGCKVIDCSVVRACAECGDRDALMCCNPFEDSGCVVKHASNVAGTAATTPMKAAKAAPANPAPTTAPPAPEPTTPPAPEPEPKTATTAPTTTTPATTPNVCAGS